MPHYTTPMEAMMSPTKAPSRRQGRSAQPPKTSTVALKAILDQGSAEQELDGAYLGQEEVADRLGIAGNADKCKALAAIWDTLERTYLGRLSGHIEGQAMPVTLTNKLISCMATPRLGSVNDAEYRQPKITPGSLKIAERHLGRLHNIMGLKPQPAIQPRTLTPAGFVSAEQLSELLQEQNNFIVLPNTWKSFANRINAELKALYIRTEGEVNVALTHPEHSISMRYCRIKNALGRYDPYFYVGTTPDERKGSLNIMMQVAESLGNIFDNSSLVIDPKAFKPFEAIARTASR